MAKTPPKKFTRLTLPSVPAYPAGSENIQDTSSQTWETQIPTPPFKQLTLPTRIVSVPEQLTTVTAVQQPLQLSRPTGKVTKPLTHSIIKKRRKNRRYRSSKWTWLLALASLALVVLLIGSVNLEYQHLLVQIKLPSNPYDSNSTSSPSNPHGSNSTSSASNSAIQNLLAGPPTIQITLDQRALSSSLLSGLIQQMQNSGTALSIIPLLHNRVALKIDAQLTLSGVQRNIPIEVDGTFQVNKQKHLQLLVDSFKRDGLTLGPDLQAQAQASIDQLLAQALPSLDLGTLLNGLHSGSISTNAPLHAAFNCDNGAIRFLLGAKLNLSLQGLHRVLPIELAIVIGINQSHHFTLQVEHFTRDGAEVGPAALNQIQNAISQIFKGSASSLAPNSLTSGIELMAVRTNTEVVCGKSTEMFVLQFDAPYTTR